MTGHAVVIAGGGPTGLMLAGELALAGVDVAIVERRAGQDLPGSRAGGLHSRTIEILDQRGIADRFLSEGQVAQVGQFSGVPLDISDFPTRHPYSLGLWQNHIERILAGWVGELPVTIYRGREVTGFAQEETGVDVELSDGQSLRAARVVIDIGVHCGFEAPDEVGAGDWTYDKAWAFLTAHANQGEAWLRFELDRYLGWPGQAPSYKIGERLWLELRAEVEHREGDAFDLKAFHRRALDIGCVPLDTLRQAVLGEL